MSIRAPAQDANICWLSEHDTDVRLGQRSVAMQREPKQGAQVDPYVRWFKDIRLGDVPTVGGKTASLGELYCALSERDIKVPNGFALTAQAYRDALSGAQALDKLHGLLDGLDKAQVKLLRKAAAAARDIVYAATGTAALAETITAAYRKLEEEYGTNVAVAVRSSRRQRICRPRASPASTRASSMFAVQGQSLTHVGVALRRSSPIAQSPTGSTMASITSRWRSRSV
jgi:Pyruvate phosphate dikinase, AMP/ATP-binding domain